MQGHARFVTLSLIMLHVVISTARASPDRSTDSWDAALGNIDALFEKFARDNHVPGLIYGVVRDGELRHVHGIGVQDLTSKIPVDADTVFRIASLTKSFTALAVLKLRDDGRLHLDATVKSMVPELKIISHPDISSATIRLRDLLNHTAGFVTDDPWGDRQLDMPEATFSHLLRAGIPLAQRPGDAFDYSNTGYAILGRVITQRSGIRFQDYISQTILRPLGMKATVWETRSVASQHRATGYAWIDDHFEPQPSLGDGAFGAMAGLHSTASDYGRYVAWLLSAWTPNPPEVSGTIAPATVREAGHAAAFSQMGKRVEGPDGKPCPVVWMYGAGFYVVADCELGTMLRHPGGLPGFGSQVLLLPRLGVGIFAFANLTYAHLSDPVVEAAVRLKRAGLLTEHILPPSPSLLNAAAATLRIVQSADINTAANELSVNLLSDSSASRRNSELRHYREQCGECTSIAPVEMLNTLAGRFRLICARAALDVSILLTPTPSPKIQYLEFQSSPPVRVN